MATCPRCSGSGKIVIREVMITRTTGRALKGQWGMGRARLTIECYDCGGWGDNNPDPNRLAIAIDTERPRR